MYDCDMLHCCNELNLRSFLICVCVCFDGVRIFFLTTQLSFEHLCWWTQITFDVALVVMLLQHAAVVGQLLVFVRLRQEVGPRRRTAAILR